MHHVAAWGSQLLLVQWEWVPFWPTGRRPVVWAGAGSGPPWRPAGQGQQLWSPPLLPMTNTFTCLTEVFPGLTHHFRRPAHFSVSVLHFPVSPAPKLKPMACKVNVRTCFQRPGLKPRQCGYLSVLTALERDLAARLGDAGGWHWSQRVVLILATTRHPEHLALSGSLLVSTLQVRKWPVATQTPAQIMTCLLLEF